MIESAELGFRERMRGAHPFIQWLSGLKVPVSAAAVSSVVVMTLLRLAWAANLGLVTSRGETVGFVEDPAMYVNVVTVGIVWALCAWLAVGVPDLFEKLFAGGVVDGGSEDEDRGAEKQAGFLADASTSLGSRKWFWVSTAAGVGSALLLSLPGYLERMKTGDSWSMVDPVSVALSTAWSAFSVGGVVYFILMCAAVTYWLRKMFQVFDINIQPLHPDGSGGLEPLVKFSMTLNHAFVLFGAMIVLTSATREYLAHGVLSFTWSTDVVVGITAYLLATPAVFFLFTSIPHDKMKAAKSKVMRLLSDSYSRSQKDILDGIRDSDEIDSREMTHLKSLDELQAMIQKFPVWPLNVSNLVRFSSSFLSPLFLGLVIDFLSNRLAG